MSSMQSIMLRDLFVAAAHQTPECISTDGNECCDSHCRCKLYLSWKASWDREYRARWRLKVKTGINVKYQRRQTTGTPEVFKTSRTYKEFRVRNTFQSRKSRRRKQRVRKSPLKQKDRTFQKRGTSQVGSIEDFITNYVSYNL